MAAGSRLGAYGECLTHEAYVFTAGTMRVVGTDAGLVTRAKAGAAFDMEISRNCTRI